MVHWKDRGEPVELACSCGGVVTISPCLAFAAKRYKHKPKCPTCVEEYARNGMRVLKTGKVVPVDEDILESFDRHGNYRVVAELLGITRSDVWLALSRAGRTEKRLVKRKKLAEFIHDCG